jgi:acetyltransferase-like isoleucine patch superfamily enzyme
MEEQIMIPYLICNKRTKRQQKIYILIRGRWKRLTGYIYPDVYFSSKNVHIGVSVAVAPGVKILSRNHDLYDIWMHGAFKPVIIGDYCWIGANAVILPGVTLGNHTIVGAGSVVTKSFPEGYCVIVGNPARKIKDLDPKKCKENQHEN